MTGAELAAARRKGSLSQYELAERLKVTRGLVSHIETNRSKPEAYLVKAWFRALGQKVPVKVEIAAPVALEVTHLVFTCPVCRASLYDNPPNSGLFEPCACGWGRQG